MKGPLLGGGAGNRHLAQIRILIGFVAAAGRIRLTAAMREQYRRHVAEDREAAARDCEAKRILARLGTLAKY